MDQSKIAVRYAKAFFSLAKEKGRLDSLTKDIGEIHLLCTQSADFRLILESPVLKTSRKIRLSDQLLKGKIDGLTLAFIRLLIQNKREAHLPAICRYFLKLYQDDKGIKSAVLTSAVSLSPEMVQQIHSYLEKEFSSAIEMKVQTDPKLIGGFVLRVGDKQVNASVLNQLKEIRNSLLKTE